MSPPPPTGTSITIYRATVDEEAWNLNTKGLPQPKTERRDFPGGPVVKNPPVNAGNVDSIPGPGRSHVSGQLSP